MTIVNPYGNPGQGAAVSTSENQFVWGGDASRVQVLKISSVIDGAARDAANTPTSHLRTGLLMGIISATGKYSQFDATNTNGTDSVGAVLSDDMTMIDLHTQTNEEKHGPLVVSCPVKARNLRILGAAFVGHAQEFVARRQMGALGFRFDDDVQGFNHGAPRNQVKATDYTVVKGDNGTSFQAITADADFTLPAIQAGLEFTFARVDDFEMAVISAEGDNMVVGNDASADSITFTTASEQIGAQVAIKGVYINGTLKWVAILPHVPFGVGAATLAYAIGT